MQNVLFVCSYNVCRSAAAEAVFRYIIEATDSPMRVASAAARTHQSGVLADPSMCHIAAQRGYDLSAHRSQTIDMFDAKDFTHTLWFDTSHCEPLRLWAQDSAVKISSLMEYSKCFPMGDLVAADTELGYRMMLDHIEDACLGLWHHLK